MAEYLDFFNVYIMGLIEVSFQIYWHVVFLSAIYRKSTRLNSSH